MIIDQNTDTTFATLRRLVTTYPDLAEHVKTAQVGEQVRDSLPASAFADPANRLFPVHTPADAILSKAYATKVANLAEDVAQQIDTALSIFNAPTDIFATPKVASQQAEEPIYLAEGQKKLAFYRSTPISEGESALKRNHRKLSPETLRDGAIKLVKEAHRRGQEVSPWTLKYAGLVQCNTQEARDWLEARANQATDEGIKQAYTKLANVTYNLDSSIGRDDLVMLSNSIGEIDKLAGFSQHYGKRMPDPVATIFNTKIAMQPMVDLAGRSVPVERLMTVAPEVYGDILGSDIVEEISQDGELIPDSLLEILDTLPVDMKKSLVEELGL